MVLCSASCPRPRRIPLRDADKIGCVRFPDLVQRGGPGSTSSSAVALLHSFWYEEALKAFTTVTVDGSGAARWATGASR